MLENLQNITQEGSIRSIKEPKLSKKGFVVLCAFGKNEKLHGWEIMYRTKIRSGTLYPLLKKLEEAGWLESKNEEGDERELGRRLRIYHQLTPEGETKAKERIEQLTKAKERIEQLTKQKAEMLQRAIHIFGR